MVQSAINWGGAFPLKKLGNPTAYTEVTGT